MARDPTPSDAPDSDSGSPSPSDGADSSPRDSAVPPRERAFALHCEGLRSPAIARRLGIPARTIRSWLAHDLAALARQSQAKRPERLALAVERHLAVAAAAWDAYHRAAEYDDLALAHLRSALGDDATAAQPKLSPAAVRSLATALAAQREVARLQGLHIYQPEPEAPGHQHILLRDDDEIIVRPEEMEAWIAFRDRYPRDTDLAGGPAADRPEPGDRPDPAGATEIDAAPIPTQDAAEMATASPADHATPPTPATVGPAGRHDEIAAEMAMPPTRSVGPAATCIDDPALDPAAPHGLPSGDDAAPTLADPAADPETETAEAESIWPRPTPTPCCFYYDANSYNPWFAARRAAGLAVPGDPDDPDDSCDPAEPGPFDDDTDDAETTGPLDWRPRARLGLTLIPFDSFDDSRPDVAEDGPTTAPGSPTAYPTDDTASDGDLRRDPNGASADPNALPPSTP